MAGHSKWANIKHRKSLQDAKRGKIFTRLIREITITARLGASPDDNPRLRSAITKALACNMTKDTIDRAIAKGVGIGENDNVEEIIYEGYGPSGVAIMIEAMTDNRNRTVAEIRHVLTKNGGNMGSHGCVSYLFSRIGEIRLDGNTNEELLFSVTLDAGAHDLITEQSLDATHFVVSTAPEKLDAVCKALAKANIDPINVETYMRPTSKIAINAKDTIKILTLIESLEDLDDTHNVYHNADISDESLQTIDKS